MNFPVGYSALVFAMATITLVITSAGIMYSRNEARPSITRHVVDVKTAVSKQDPSSVNVVQYYHQSKIPKFAEKHQRELRAAKKDRKTECGSIISVSAIDCQLCVLLVEALSDLVSKGATQDDIVKFSTKICIELEIEDERVCPAVVDEFKVRKFHSII